MSSEPSQPTSSPAPASPSSPSPAPGPSAPSTSPPSGAPGGSAPGGSTREGPSRQEQMGVPNEVVAVLGYDPFGPVDPAAPQPEPAPPQAQPQQPAPVAAPAAQGPSEIETLRQQLGQMRNELQQFRQPAQGQPQPGGQPAQPTDPVPAYHYEIPDQLVQLMASEDPGHRKMALSNVMTAVSRSVHGLMQKELAQVIPALARQVMTEHLGQQEVGKDFYGTYRHLDKPELRPLIYQIAAGWAAQNPQAGWNAATRDAIARVVHQTFNIPMPGQQGNGQAPPQAPVMMPTMSRPAANHGMSEQEEMLDLLR